jgi:Fe-S cluster biogenesis protein NfuA
VARALDGLLPAMAVDGGGARILSADASGVVIELIGSCTFCPSRGMSAEALERGLRARLPTLGHVRIFTKAGGHEETVTASAPDSACA